MSQLKNGIIRGSPPFGSRILTIPTPWIVDSTVYNGGMRKTPADEALLSLLREDARASTALIARKLGLSRTTVQNRIARLEAEGVIRGYTVRIDDEHERLRIRAHIMLTVRPKQMPAVVRALQAMPEVRVVYSISGGHDLIVLAATATVGDMDVLTDAIGAIDGVDRTNSSIILATKFER